MKKYINIFILALFAFLLFGCGEKNITSISVTKEVTLFEGEEKAVEVNYQPLDATEKLSIVVSDPEVATFDNNKIKGLKKGQTTIVFESKNIREVTSVTVLNLDDIELTISLEKQEYFVDDNAKLSIHSSYDFGEYEIKATNDAKVENENITFVKSGLCEITVSPKSYPTKQAKLEVTVKEKVTVSDIIYSLKDKMIVGDMQEVTVTLLPEGIVEKVVITSSDESVISVENNTLKALKSGSSIITITSGGIRKEVTVLVLDESEVTIETNITTEYNKDESVYVTITTNVYDTEFDIYSSNPAIAKVEGKKIEFINQGTVQITVALKEHENIKVTIDVLVKQTAISGKEVQKLLKSTLEAYLSSYSATVQIDLVNDQKQFVEIFAFEMYKELYTSLYHESNSNIPSILMIKDGMLYINLNDVKTKFVYGEEEQSELYPKENIAYVLADVTGFYEDDAFFNCLVLKEVKDNTKIYSLDIRNYLYSATKPTINVLNVDEVLFEVEEDGNTVSSCNLVMKSLDKQKSVKVSYLGLGFNVNYPNDLDTYFE